MRGKLGVRVLVLVFAVFLFFQGCAQIYKNPDFDNITKDHKRVAVLPFKVSISQPPKDFTAEMVKDAEQKEGFMMQRQIYGKFLGHQSKGEYTIEFQDVDETNALLAKDSITYGNMEKYTKTELGRVLNVDAVLSASIIRTHPMSSAASIALGVIFGVFGSTNRVDINVTIHEVQGNKLLWQYDHQASGSVGSSPEELAKSLMGGISKTFPYKRKK
jgi:hypothetical protein